MKTPRLDHFENAKSKLIEDLKKCKDFKGIVEITNIFNQEYKRVARGKVYPTDAEFNWIDYDFNVRSINVILVVLNNYFRKNNPERFQEVCGCPKRQRGISLREISEILTADNLMECRNCGEKTIADIQEVFKEFGLTLKSKIE